MKYSSPFTLGFVPALAVGVLGTPVAPNPANPLTPRQVITPGGPPCGEHGPDNRACWDLAWTVETDYDVEYPPAFHTREYDFYITNETEWTGPDGVVKHVMLINGQFPGPTIEADWGDYIQVNVHNQLQDNGTSIHWHGIRQLGESNQDGANGVTECPIPPGGSKSYAFHVQQYGTSWYHSHYTSQYGNGIVGAMVVNGPASADYDIDLGPYMITDYYYETADVLQRRAELITGGPPDSNNILFRGKGMHANGVDGEFDRLTLTPGMRHRVRLINTSVDNSFTVSLVGHTFKVIQTDLVPVEPIVKDSLFLAVGQRYDVIIEATQPVDNYWFNATLQATNLCGRTDNPYPAAIFSYEGAGDGNPTNQGTPITAGCAGETGFVPIVSRTIDPAEFDATNEMKIDLETPVLDFPGQVFRWEINDVDIDIEWDHPTLERIYEGSEDFAPKANIIELNEAEVWTFWILQNTFLLPHPIHLHGHDFLILGTGSGTFDQSNPDHMAQLDFDNPTRRDVAQMPGSGWLVMAFHTDNPGAWLLHCHIGWHVSQGLGMQFLERKDEIAGLMKLYQMVPNCDAWREYAPTSPWLPKLDSGLKMRKKWTH